MNKNDNLWLHHLEMFKDYIKEYHTLPTNKTIYNEFKLGGWITNQASALTRGELSDFRINCLNEVNPFWNGTKEEKQKENMRLLITSDWKRNVPCSHTSIDNLYEEEKLYICLLAGIYDVETIIEYFDKYKYNAPNNFYKLGIDIFVCYSKIIQYIDPDYVRLICELSFIYGDKLYDVSKIKDFLRSFCFKSPEDTRQKINGIIDLALTDRDKEIIYYRFGINGREKKTLAQLSEMYNVNSERIRQIEAKALRVLRHPSFFNKLYETGTVLDKYIMSNNVKANLYRAGIDTEELLNILIESGEINIELKKEFQPIKIKTTEDLMNNSVEEIIFSKRVRNCLRRGGIRTVGQLASLAETPDNLIKLRNFGKSCLSEVCDGLNKYLNTDKYHM